MAGMLGKVTKARNIQKERNALERAVVKEIVREEATGSFKIELMRETRRNRILSFSPGSAYYKTYYVPLDSERYYYSALSKYLHTYPCRRTEIEVEMTKILPVFMYTFEYVNKLLESDSRKCSLERFKQNVKDYAEYWEVDIPSNHKMEKLFKLTKAWKVESENSHYKLTKQDKRKLKKLASAREEFISAVNRIDEW